MKISIVTTLYRTAGTIHEFHRRAMAAASALSDDVEMILVNDGSPDDSLILALGLHRADPRVVVVDLARNFGHHKAMMTGLAHARGDLVFLIDSDLDEEPELLNRFHARLAQGDCDVVYGVQEKRRGNLFQRIAGEFFFFLVKSLSDHPLPRNLVTARLMTRDYVRALIRHRDRDFLIAHLWEQTGFRQVPIEVTKHARSPSTYSLAKRIELALKHVTTTSTKLLHLLLFLGTGVAALAAITIAYFVGRYFLWGIGVTGWTSLIVSVWFLGGLTILALGVLGIYIANILTETKRRPYTVVRKIYRADDAAASGSNVIKVPPRGQRVES